MDDGVRLRVLGALARLSDGAAQPQEAGRRAVGILAADRDDFSVVWLYLAGGRDTLKLVGGASGDPPYGDTVDLAGSPLGGVVRGGRPALVDGWWAVPLRGRDESLGVLLAPPGDAEFLELVGGALAAQLAAVGARLREHELRESLALLDRAKSDLFSHVTNELRNPLTLISAPAEEALADEDEPLPAVHRDRVSVVRRNAARMRRLLNNVLDFTRLEKGGLHAERVATDLPALTRAIAASFAPAIERGGLTLVVDCPPSDGPVHVDREMWERIVLNLLANALKFTPAGQVRLTLDIGASVVLTVSDTGVGIPEDKIPLLFQRFHRVRSDWSRSGEGAGIGLALVQELVRLHGGDVSVASERGRGSTFTVTVPKISGADAKPVARAPWVREGHLAEALAWMAAEASAPEVVVESAGSTEDATVLVVEHDPDLLRYLTDLLRPHWTVWSVRNTSAALDLVSSRRPDLVLSDISTTPADEFGVLDALRRDPETAGVPVILLSAQAGAEAAAAGLHAGADDYLVKPFSPVDLIARVRSNIELARSRNYQAAWRAALVDSLDDGFFVMDSDGTVREMNASCAVILGYDQGDAPYVMPHPWWPDAQAEPTAHAEVRAAFREVLSSGAGRFTVRVRRRGGQPIWVLFSLTAVPDVSGSDLVFVGMARDVTVDRGIAEREAAQSRFAATLASAVAVGEVIAAAEAELGSPWQARHVRVVTWDERGFPTVHAAPGSPVGWESLPADTRAALTRLHDGQRQDEVQTNDGLLRGIGGAVDVVGDATAVWLDFDPPRRLSGMDRSLFGVLCGQFGLALSRARAYDEQRTVAVTLQRSILGPSSLPAGFAVRYEPAQLEVGGDWYDVIDLGADRVGLVVGDCVGRGLGAASVMGQLRSAARALLLRANSPVQVLTALDDFARTTPDSACTTVLCAVVDRTTGELTYSSAGHPPGIVARPDGWHDLLDQATSVPLLVSHPAVRTEATTRLPPGATLLLYSDGLVERRSEPIDTGLARAADVLAAGLDLPEEYLADRLLAQVPPESGHDDVVVLLYRHHGPAVRRFTRSFPAAATELAPTRQELRSWLVGTSHNGEIDADTVDRVVLAVSEACSNAVEHGYRNDPGGTVHLSAMREEDTLSVVVSDAGEWLDPVTPTNRGRGLPIMSSVSDTFSLDTTEHGTIVRFSIDVRG
jgi:PAS domain S-box-containing protein